MKKAIVFPVLSVITICLVCWAALWYTGENFASGVSRITAKSSRRYGSFTPPRPAAVYRQRLVNFKEEPPGNLELNPSQIDSKTIRTGSKLVQEASQSDSNSIPVAPNLQKKLPQKSPRSTPNIEESLQKDSILRKSDTQEVVLPTDSILRPSRLLYLSQTECCLPSRLLSLKIIGNTSACQCDVLVLSYKQACNKTPPKHVQYLFNSSTSWASGRNLLYEVAKGRGNVYLYFIFMDDDIGLRTKTNNMNPWREFEQFLLQIEPAVAAVDTDTNSLLQHALIGRQQQKCTLKQASDYVPAPRFDPAFNAYHYEAARHLLPYTTRYDNISWWYPDLYFEVKCELMFAGQTVLHTRVTATNPLHRHYPRGNPSITKWATLVEQVKAELPKRYQNVSLLSEWKQDRLEHRRRSSTLCLSPPSPHMPIRPFAYLDGKIKSAHS